MKVKRIILPFQIKEVSEEENTYEGIASYYGNRDLGDDIMVHGVFAESIQKNKGQVPVLVDHHASIMKQAGFGVDAYENGEGLNVKFELNPDTEAGKTSKAIIEQAKKLGQKVGLSVGFNIIQQAWDETDKLLRHIQKADLWEYSIVVFPMNPLAQVKSVKDLDGEEEIISKKRDIERALRDEGCSSSEAKRAVSAIFERDAKADTDAQAVKSLTESMNKITQNLKY